MSVCGCRLRYVCMCVCVKYVRIYAQLAGVFDFNSMFCTNVRSQVC